MACLRFGFTTAFNYVSGPPAKCRGDAASSRVSRQLRAGSCATAGSRKADLSQRGADAVGSVRVSVRFFLPWVWLRLSQAARLKPRVLATK